MSAKAESAREFRAVLRGPLPVGWLAKESITLLSPDGQANVIASSEPLQSSIDLQGYAGAQGKLLASEFPGYREFAFEPIKIFGGLDGWLRKFEWTPPDGVPITQLQTYAVEFGRGYTATATTPSASFTAFEDQLREVLLGLAVGP
jgi:hypothetical protein